MNNIDYELDIPYIPNNYTINELMCKNELTFNEACKLDYNENWKDVRNMFRLNTRCVTSYFSRVISIKSDKDCKKIVVECVPKLTYLGVNKYIDVLTTQVLFDVDSFICAGSELKKMIALELLSKGLENIDERIIGLSDNFQKAKEDFIKHNYCNCWLWRKISDNRTTISIWVYHEIEHVTIKASIQSCDEIKDIILKTTLPDEWYYSQYLFKVSFLSNNSATLESKTGEVISFSW